MLITFLTIDLDGAAWFATPLEILAISGLMAVPVAAACAAGLGSACLIFGCALAFDFLRAMGHCNVEVFPGWLFQAVPAARYLIGTPTYVSSSIRTVRELVPFPITFGAV
jgi:hypothetical protein